MVAPHLARWRQDRRRRILHLLCRPGPRAKRHWDLARKAGLKCVAQVQINNSWECSAIPFIPALYLIAEHRVNLTFWKVDGMMLGWTLGGYPSPNLQVAQRLTDRLTDATKIDAALADIARERYGPDAASNALTAWELLQPRLSRVPLRLWRRLLLPRPDGPRESALGKADRLCGHHGRIPYDDVKRWCGPYPPTIFAQQFEKLADGWERGLSEFRLAAQKAAPDRAPEARRDLLVARAAHPALPQRPPTRSASSSPATPRIARPTPPSPALPRRIRHRRRLFDIASHDSRIGFEASNHYYYLPQDLVEKVINCRYLSQRFEAP